MPAVMCIGDSKRQDLCHALPFPEAMRALMSEQQISFRKLVLRTTKTREGGLSLGYVGRLAQGKEHPTLETIAVVAHALGVAPEYFGEYRLAVARRELDEREVGLDQALANLERAPNLIGEER